MYPTWKYMYTIAVICSYHLPPHIKRAVYWEYIEPTERNFMYPLFCMQCIFPAMKNQVRSNGLIYNPAQAGGQRFGCCWCYDSEMAAAYQMVSGYVAH